MTNVIGVVVLCYLLSVIIRYNHFITEHVWQVTMQKKGLGERRNIHGPHRLCLTDRTLSLVKIGAGDNSASLEFPVSSQRFAKEILSDLRSMTNGGLLSHS